MSSLLKKARISLPDEPNFHWTIKNGRSRVEIIMLLLFILVLVALNGVVSFVIAAFVRSTALSVFASTIITASLIAIYFLNQAAHSSDAADVILAGNITAMLSTPVFLGTSFGFIVLARRFSRKPVKSS